MAAGSGGYLAHGQYGECTVGELEFVLKRQGQWGTRVWSLGYVGTAAGGGGYHA